MKKYTFPKKKLNIDKLISYGFCEDYGQYRYSKEILDSQMRLELTIEEDGTLSERVIDISVNEEYVLHQIASAEGAFVGMVKEAVENEIQKLLSSCYDGDIFQFS